VLLNLVCSQWYATCILYLYALSTANTITLLTHQGAKCCKSYKRTVHAAKSSITIRLSHKLAPTCRQTLGRPRSEFASQLVADPNPLVAFLCRCTWSVAECISVYVTLLYWLSRSMCSMSHARLCRILRHNQPAATGVHVTESINISLVNFDSVSRRRYRRCHIRLCGLHNLCLLLKFSLFWQNSRKTCRSPPTSGVPTRPGDVSHCFMLIIRCS
jgi:hypothetical protein